MTTLSPFKPTSFLTTLALLAGATALSAGPVLAQALDPVTGLPQVEEQQPGEPVSRDRNFPFVDIELGTELGFDSGVNSDDRDNEIDDAFAEAALAMTLGLSPIFSVNIGLSLERTNDAPAGDDVYFENIGLYADTLNLQADIDAWTIYAGKFGPTFGTAWDVTPGVYGTDFAGDYELSERLGLGVAYAFETSASGTYTVNANLFTIDTSFLSDSLFESRGRTRLRDGGAGNTEKLDNVSVTLDMTDLPARDGLSLHLGYRHLQGGVGSDNDEDGYVLGSAYEFENGATKYALTGEVAYFDGFDGTSADATFVTAGLFVQQGQWHGEVSGGLRHFDHVEDGSSLTGFSDIDDKFIQVSAGYEFENGIDLSGGVKFAEEDDVSTTTVGLRLTKAFTYSSDGLGFQD